MNKSKVSRFSLSYYSLITQIIIINLITALIGFIFVSFFNLFLLNNNKNINNKIDQINGQVNDIKSHLEKNAIFRTPQFNEKTGEIIFFSEPQLDPYASQLYVENIYLDQPNEIKIYNSNLIKYVDTRDLYIVGEVKEVDIDDSFKKPNFFQQYKAFYLKIFNRFQQFFYRQKMKEIIEPVKHDVNLIIELIKKNIKISKIFIHENDSLSFNVLTSLSQDNKIYGVVIVRGFLTQESQEAALISFNLFNLYLIIVFFMFLLSIIFTRSIIRPIKTLSFLAKAEQDKFHPPQNTLNYPIRNDEIGGLSHDIQNMSKALKSRINELEKFTADVSHELKNPLASIKASNELLVENKIKPVNKKLLFSNIIKDIDRMNRLISDISEYTRTQIEVEKQIFNEFKLIDFIKDLKLSFEHNDKKIKILLDFNNLEIKIQANMGKLAQVFINLIENAISFSPQQSSILIQQIQKDGQVIIYIADQGCGVNEKLKDKIFERFYTDRQDKAEYHTGLGLSISKTIMESFGGSLELSNKILDRYNGACFKLGLPIKA